MNYIPTLIKSTNLVLQTQNEASNVNKYAIWKKTDDNIEEVLTEAQIAIIGVEDAKKVFEHPIESGKTIVDDAIFELKNLSLKVYISDDNIKPLQELEELYLKNELLTIRAGNKIIENVLLSSKPFELSAKMLDKTVYTVGLREAPQITPAYVKMPPNKPIKKSSSSRVNSGVKQAKKVSKSTKSQSWMHNAIHGRK